MDNLSFRDQVLLFYTADIVLSTHGCALTNLMFSTPHTVAIECHPPYYFEPSYMTVTMISRVHYIQVTTFYPHQMSNNRWREAELAYYNGYFFPNKKLLHKRYVYDSVNPPLFKVLTAIKDATEYLRRWRFIYNTNYKWSPIFPFTFCLSHFALFRRKQSKHNSTTLLLLLRIYEVQNIITIVIHPP